jgi:hypothetical protein
LFGIPDLRGKSQYDFLESLLVLSAFDYAKEKLSLFAQELSHPHLLEGQKACDNGKDGEYCDESAKKRISACPRNGMIDPRYSHSDYDHPEEHPKGIISHGNVLIIRGDRVQAKGCIIFSLEEQFAFKMNRLLPQCERLPSIERFVRVCQDGLFVHDVSSFLPNVMPMARALDRRHQACVGRVVYSLANL